MVYTILRGGWQTKGCCIRNGIEAHQGMAYRTFEVFQGVSFTTGVWHTGGGYVSDERGGGFTAQVCTYHGISQGG